MKDFENVGVTFKNGQDLLWKLLKKDVVAHVNNRCQMEKMIIEKYFMLDC